MLSIVSNGIDEQSRILSLVCRPWLLEGKDKGSITDRGFQIRRWDDQIVTRLLWVHHLMGDPGTFSFMLPIGVKRDLRPYSKDQMTFR